MNLIEIAELLITRKFWEDHPKAMVVVFDEGGNTAWSTDTNFAFRNTGSIRDSTFDTYASLSMKHIQKIIDGNMVDRDIKHDWRRLRIYRPPNTTPVQKTRLRTCQELMDDDD